MLTEIENNPVTHLTFAEYICLTNLEPGNYTVAIETIDMVTKKLVKQEAFAIVQ